MEAFGMPMAGRARRHRRLDICLHAGKALAKAANAQVPKFLEEKVAAGQLGRKFRPGHLRLGEGKR